MAKSKTAESGAQNWPDEMGTMLAAKYTGYHFTWISRAAKQGLIGRLFMGRYVFTRAELDAFKASEDERKLRPNNGRRKVVS